MWCDRENPYLCEECGFRFMLATQLSDHLLLRHEIRRHAALIKPADPRSLELQEDASDQDDDDT